LKAAAAAAPRSKTGRLKRPAARCRDFLGEPDAVGGTASAGGTDNRAMNRTILASLVITCGLAACATECPAPAKAAAHQETHRYIQQSIFDRTHTGGMYVRIINERGDIVGTADNHEDAEMLVLKLQTRDREAQ
jgi:hypothetical protein